ncbi:MAG: hypothetical protein ACOX2M_09555 [Fastidiosipilaceae bacterium]|jgi:cobyrinic acid a,c-diamide synthase
MSQRINEVKTYVSLPRLMIAGVRPGDGQNTVYQAVLAALVRRKTPVQVWIAGPDSTWSALHNHIAGGAARTLDSWLLSADMMRYLLQRHGGSPRISLIQAPGGLFDGLPQGYARAPLGSAVELAEELDVPVVLALDGRQLSFDSVPLIQGIQRYVSEDRLVGFIVANTVGEEFEQWSHLISEASGIPCLGHLPQLENQGGADYLAENGQMIWDARSWIGDFDRETTRLADQADQYIDLKSLLGLAADAEPTVMSAPPYFMKLMAEMGHNEPFRLGVAQDVAFHDYNQNNLDLLVDMGARLIRFSPMRDRMLPPDLDGLYFGGGHPEAVGEELSENAPLRTRINRAVREGVPLLAEAEGIFYLGRRLESVATGFHPMLGLIPGDGVLLRRPPALSYCEMISLSSGLLGPYGASIRAVSGNRIRLTEEGGSFRVRFSASETRTGGYMSSTVCAVESKLFFHSNPDFAAAFSKACSAHAAARLSDGTKSLDIWPV